MKPILPVLFILGVSLWAEDPAKPAEQPKPVQDAPKAVTPKPPPAPPVQAAQPDPKPTPKPVPALKPEVKSTPTPEAKPEVAATPSPPPPPASPDFHKEVREILEVSCIKCHGLEKQKGDLRLDTLAHGKKGGEEGPSIEPGNLAKSLLIDRILLPEDDDDLMPPKGGPLKPEQIEILKRWVTTEAKWPQGVTLTQLTEKQLALRKAAEQKAIVELSVYPPQVNLETEEDFHKIVVVAKYADDVTRDVTAESSLVLSGTKVASIEGRDLRPLVDGNATLVVTHRDKRVDTPLRVKGAKTPRPVSFKLDVMPIFLRAGCNAGSCHGSARGQDGFMLSIWGYDPDGDHYRITRELGTRRINLAIPEESLLVEKAIEAVPHTGGKRFAKGSVNWKTLVQWLSDGVPEDVKDVAKPVGIELYPKNALLEGEEALQQMTVIARYSDGTDRDVTQLALFRSNNDVSAAIDEHGLVTAGKRGEAFIAASFNIFTMGSNFVVIPKNLKYERPKLPENNYVDKLVHEKLHKLRITPSELCSDEVFLRRAALDVTGTLPSPELYDRFMKDEAADKRAKLVNELLERKEFTEMWVMKFAELLQIRTDDNNGVSYKATLLYFNWLKDRIANNVPMNQIVRELISSTGGTFVNPSTNFYQIERDTLKLTENVAQVFMGMRIQCAQCHNHPFDRWTQDDYYSFASFFSQVGRKRAADPRESIIYNRRSGETNHPVYKKPMPPKFLGGIAPTIKSGQDRRVILSEWIASPENPFFAQNLANLVWAHFFGQGIIEPVDDVRVTNPASNPELLAELSKRFTEYDYDFKKLVRDVCNSRIYQLSTHPNETNVADTRNFARSQLRRMRAEVLLDAISQVTATKNKFQGLPLGARAVQIADGRVTNYFLTTFGRATRETVCSSEVKIEPNLSQALHLLNGEVINKRITQGNVVKGMVDDSKGLGVILDNLYVRCLSRKPREAERANLLAAVNGNENKQLALEDAFWALLNSKEFIFNH
tara:strand:+ start:165 stop:3158 length:2994 start_codon:yes stop_codon:yes gene_type:complete